MARELNIPLSRLHRLLAGRDDVIRHRNRVRLLPSAVEAARGRFGVIPAVSGLSRVETQVLVALSRRPRGTVSIRQVAKAARLSPTSTSRALSKLISVGLVRQENQRVFNGTVVDAAVYEVAWGTEGWRELAALLSRAELPRRPETPRVVAKRLPTRLANVFWTGDWREGDVRENRGMSPGAS